MDADESPSLPPAGWHDDPDDPTSLRYWDGTRWTDHRTPKQPAAPPPPPAPGTPATAPPPSAKSSWDGIRIAGAVGAGVVIVGSVSPWATVNTAFGSISVNGTDGDGTITLILGAVALGFFVFGHYLTSWIVAAVAGAVLAYDLVDISRAVGEGSNEFASISVGWGLYFALVGAVAAFAAGLVLWRRAKAPPIR